MYAVKYKRLITRPDGAQEWKYTFGKMLYDDMEEAVSRGTVIASAQSCEFEVFPMDPGERVYDSTQQLEIKPREEKPSDIIVLDQAAGRYVQG